MRPNLFWLAFGFVSLFTAALPAADDAPQERRGGREREQSPVYKARIEPHWFDGDAKLWYRNDLSGGRREYVVVDAAKGTRDKAFDHERLAKALDEAGVEDVAADRLDLQSLSFHLDEKAIEFHAGGKTWRCNLESYELTEVKDRDAADAADESRATFRDAPRASTRTGDESEVTFVNRTAGEVELFWLDTSGERRSYGKLPAGGRKEQHTFGGHVWEVVSASGRTLAIVEAEDSPTTAEVDGKVIGTLRVPSDRSRRRRGDGLRGGPTADRRSPDGQWTAFVKDYNVLLRAVESGDEHQLTTDGEAGHSYGLLDWSPDSKTLAAFRIEPGDEKQVHLIESSPREGGRAVLHSRPYALPGDKFDSYELKLFDAAKRQPIECPVDPIDFGRPRLRWNDSGHTFAFEQVDRGHQRFRIVEVNAQTGDHRNLLDERSETFIWTAHQEAFTGRLVNWLEKSDELIYASERSGWRHLYLVDTKEGAIRNAITSGEFVVRGIEHIDEDARQIWFRASGKNAGQDPYLIHYYRVNFDGTGLVALTEGNGTHVVQFSPDRKYLIDTYSRVDMPPVHELRRVDDGQLVCKLEDADISELQASGWEPPEVFTAKGRDGQTDIWGIICRPRDFDPAKKYPVIEQIYAGPQGSFVPKSFSSQRRFSSLTDLGFVVVQIDGMGTANRSKAFHDVCWHNLKDAGLPDRILWHQAVAAKYPWYDISRVGIYGGSAGGQNATGALLFHPEFYKVGVSGCGCHDNRLDKASWNEQWMGYPVGPHYAECSNIDNAHRLRGKLMLIVGEMDTNVPPESTLRLADALIKAGKDFDLVLIPGAGHGMGGVYGTRRMHDFFVRNLLGKEPPERNK